MPRPYDRRRDLPHLIHVPRDWLGSRKPEISELIIERLERAKTEARERRAFCWALAGEREILRRRQNTGTAPNATSRKGIPAVAPGSAEAAPVR